MPGWLAAIGTNELAQTYEGYHQTLNLPDGTTLTLLRSEGLSGAYLIKGGRCLGDLVAEPIALPGFEDAEAILRARGFAQKRRFMATHTGDFAIDAVAYESVKAGYIERYVYTVHNPAPGGPPLPRRFLSEAGAFPVALRSVVERLAPELEAGVAAFFQREAQGNVGALFRP
jgi:hypothetical protein